MIAYSSRALLIAKTLDGLRSGEISAGTRGAADVPGACRTVFLCGSEIARITMSPVLTSGEELFDMGAEAFAFDRPVEQAGRFDAVIARGGEESAVSSGDAELCRRCALPSGPSRADGSCWSSSRSRR